MAKLTLADLTAQLSLCAGPSKLPIAAGADGLGYVPNSLESFVAPLLADRPDIRTPANPRIVVISAAGAVGKSTVAREVAHVKSAPLWDLSLAGPIAAKHSLIGLFQAGFGVSGLPEVYRQLAAGELFLVIDALDEARVKATEPAFEAFLRDIASIAKRSARVCFVLLGRTQIAETAWLVLEDAGVSSRILTIEPFTRDQANEYIELRVRSGGGRGAQMVNTHPDPFRRARDLIFDHLKGAMTGIKNQEEPQTFLGYAPVLDAIGVLLAGETNLAATAQELQQGLQAAQPTHTGVLERVVGRVLERERAEKLVRNLKPLMATTAATVGWTNWDHLYTSREQAVRLTARILGVDAGLTVVPPALSREYEEAVAAFLPEHPFLVDGSRPANVVFESYLFAHVLLQGTRRMSEAVERRLSDPDYKPSRLFADFYLHMKPDNTAVPPAHVGWLYDALLSSETERLHVGLSLDGPEAADSGISYPATAEGEFAWYALGEDLRWTRVRSVEFQATMSADDAVQFGRYIRRASITLPSRVILGRGGEFEIGPNVNIDCGTLELNCDSLVVGGYEGKGLPASDEDDAVVLDALKYSGTLASRPIARVSLSVEWPGAEAFPWNEFKAQRPRELGKDPRMHETYRRFRRIVMTLQSHSRGSLARTRKKIENERIMRGRLGWALLNQLVKDGILELRDGFYHWVPEVARDRVGVSWQQLRRGEVSKQLGSYLSTFIAANPAL